jgi:hypothetical protein
MLAAFLSATAAGAQDPFEIQVYDAETEAPGVFGLETHLNMFVEGRSGFSPDGEWPTRHVAHVTFEPHLGLTDWMEAGIYLQSAIRPGPVYDWAGFKLRAKVRYPEALFGWLRLALNGELSFIPKRYEAAGAGGELRPIAEASFDPFTFSVNPIVAFSFSGGSPDLEPAASARVRLVEWLAVGAEYYANLGPLDGFLPAGEQTHRAFGVFDLFSRNVDLNFGVGAGTGDDSLIVKAILTLHR